MNEPDPFATWSDDYKRAQARLAAGNVHQLRQNQFKATRDLQEALTYYKSEQWQADGVEIEALDTLINGLRQKADAAATLRHQAEVNLGKLLQSQRPFEDANALAQRHSDMVRAERPASNQSDVLEPTPLEAFLTARKNDTPKPSTRKISTKKRARSL